MHLRLHLLRVLGMLVTAAVALPAHAQTQPTQGITFYQGSWDQLLAQAKLSGKPFFVDVYTDWCGPCKLMAKQTFTDTKVGAYANAEFIGYKLNAEKGEGIELARRYKVGAYPTILFFDKNGDLIGRSIGFSGPEDFLTLLTGYAERAKRRTDATDPQGMQEATPAEKAKLSKLFQTTGN